MRDRICYSNGSNFTIDRLSESPLICGHNNTQGEVQVIVCDDDNCDSRSTCDATTKPIQCSHTSNGTGSTISLQPSNSTGYSGSNMMYKCCLSNSCDTTVNIQGKYMWIL